MSPINTPRFGNRIRWRPKPAKTTAHSVTETRTPARHGIGATVQKSLRETENWAFYEAARVKLQFLIVDWLPEVTNFKKEQSRRRRVLPFSMVEEATDLERVGQFQAVSGESSTTFESSGQPSIRAGP